MKVDPLCILLVEDDPLNMRLAHDVLEFRGHTILEARNVAEGHAHLAETEPDIILTDIQIPGGGGEVLLQEIRANGHAKIPVIAVTAFAMRGDRERFVAAGFDGYLSKPIDVRTFGEEVEAFVRK